MPDRRSRLPSVLIVAAIAVYFLFLAHPALKMDFTVDDVANLGGAMTRSWGDLLADQALFFRYTPVVRPIGALFYKTMHFFYGDWSAAYHAACFLLLIVNIALAHAVALELSGSRAAAAFAALLFAHHNRMVWLYWSPAFCFDIFAALFYFSALLFYVKHRRAGVLLGSWSTLCWLLLYILGLNSKESAASLPLLVLFYELVEHPPCRWSLKGCAQLAVREGRVAALGAMVTLAFILGRLGAEGSSLSIEGFRPKVSLGNYLAHAYYWLRQAFYEPAWLTPVAALALLAGFIVFVIWRRRTDLGLALALMLIGILPIAFIFQRGLDAAYIAYFGLCYALGTAMQSVAGLLGERRVTMRAWKSQAAWIAVFACTMSLMAVQQLKVGAPNPQDLYSAVRPLRLAIEEVRSIQPRIKRGARVLWIKDPFPQWSHLSRALLIVACNDPSLKVDYAEETGDSLTPQHKAAYDVVLSWENGRPVIPWDN